MITESMPKVDTGCMMLLESAHILIAGTTGSGKSVLLNRMLYSLIKANMYSFDYNDQRPELYLFDTKRVELVQYSDYPNAHRITEPERAVDELDFIIECMEGVYWRMEQDGLRKTNEPPVYIVIDELADILDYRGVLERLIKIGRLGRAANYHLLCCTQDPSRKTLSAQLMQNFTCKIALRCEDEIESRQIIGRSGAENLPQYGTALIKWDKQGDFMEFSPIPDEDIINLVQSIRRGYNFTRWLHQKPTFKERLLRMRNITREEYFSYAIDPDYVTKIEMGKATV